jgi:UDP-GlcNAc:undecaprenyl-phosphate GlcNAc-1-phosphate transferase
LNVEWLALLAGVIVAVILVRLRWFGHGEMMLVGDRLKSMASSFIKLQGPHSHDSAIRLQGNGAWAEQWTRLMSAAQELNLKTTRLDINAPALHESYHARWVNPCDDDVEEGDSTWSAAIPLVWRGQTVGRLEVTGGRDGLPVWKKIALLSEHVGDLELILCRLADDAGLMVQPLWDFIEPGSETADLSLTK